MFPSPARRTTVVAGLLAAPVLLAAVAPDPARAWSRLSEPTTDPSGAVVAVVALAAWALAAYLVAGGLLVLASRVPGLLGRCAGAVAARTVPAAVRRGLAVALGTTLTLGTAGALPAGAAPLVGPGAAPDSLALALPPSTALSLDWPTAPTDAGRPPQRPTTVVRPGDTLWALAEQDLRATGRVASPAAVAAAWPSWWAANREVVGADPHLLLPGTELVTPPSPEP